MTWPFNLLVGIEALVSCLRLMMNRDNVCVKDCGAKGVRSTGMGRILIPSKRYFLMRLFSLILCCPSEVLQTFDAI